MMGCSECYGSFVEQGKLELIALWGCSECYGGFVEQGKLESFVRAFWMWRDGWIGNSAVLRLNCRFVPSQFASGDSMGACYDNKACAPQLWVLTVASILRSMYVQLSKLNVNLHNKRCYIMWSTCSWIYKVFIDFGQIHIDLYALGYVSPSNTIIRNSEFDSLLEVRS